MKRRRYGRCGHRRMRCLDRHVDHRRAPRRRHREERLGISVEHREDLFFGRLPGPLWNSRERRRCRRARGFCARRPRRRTRSAFVIRLGARSTRQRARSTRVHRAVAPRLLVLVDHGRDERLDDVRREIAATDRLRLGDRAEDHRRRRGLADAEDLAEHGDRPWKSRRPRGRRELPRGRQRLAGRPAGRRDDDRAEDDERDDPHRVTTSLGRTRARGRSRGRAAPGSACARARATRCCASERRRRGRRARRTCRAATCACRRRWRP